MGTEAGIACCACIGEAGFEEGRGIIPGGGGGGGCFPQGAAYAAAIAAACCFATT